MNTKRTLAFQVFACLAVFILLFSSVQPVLGAPLAQESGPEPTPEAPAEPAGGEESPPAAPGFAVSGQVVDELGAPLAGVTVSDAQGQTALTGADGAYVLPGLQPGRYIITPALEGATLLPYYRVVDVLDADISGVDFYKGEPPAPPVFNGPIPETHRPADYTGEPASEPEVGALAAFSLGTPGTVYRYERTFGTSEEPYLADTEHIFRASGITIDSSDRLLVAEELGKRILRYTSAGANDLEIGKAGAEYQSEKTFQSPFDVAVDGSGNIWVSDSQRIIGYNSSGEFIAQLPRENPWEAGDNEDHFNQPYGIVYGDGMLFVMDNNNHRVQVFALVIGKPAYFRTIGETHNPGGGNNQFNGPFRGTYYDHALYVADIANHRIQKCEFTGSNFECSTFMGITGEQGDDFNHLRWPSSIAFGASHVYIGDGGNRRVLVCDLDGTNCAHFAGTAGEQGNDNNHFTWISDIALDSSGKLYVSDFANDRVQIYNPDGSYFATRGVTGVPYLTDTVHFNAPKGVAVDPNDGSIYVTEDLGARLIKLDSSGVQQWAVGEPGVYGNDDQHFGSDNWVMSLGIDSHGRIYVPDQGNYRVQIYLPDGTLWGTIGESGVPGDDNYHFSCVKGVAIGPDDDIFITDGCHVRVQVYDSNRNYKATLGETGVRGTDNAHFGDPWGIAVDHDGNIYVADANNYRVQKCRLDGSGGGTCAPFAGVTGVSGRDFPYLTHVNSVAVDQQGRVFIADDWEQRIQVFDPNGAYLTTIGGNWGPNTGQFRNPWSLAIDPDGNVFVADRLNHRIQKFSPGVPGWDQMNLNGFGSVWNRGVTTLDVLNGQLYAGSSSWDQGARIWRTADGSNWEALNDYGFGLMPRENFVVDSIVYGGKLYFGLGWTGNPGQIWRYDGSVWEQVTGDGFGNSNNVTANAFAAYDGNLYVVMAHMTDGLEIWKSPTGDAGSWTQVVSGGLGGNAHVRAALGLAVFDDKLYVDAWNDENIVEIWSYDGTSWVQVRADNFGDSANGTEDAGLGVFGDYLYVGLRNLTSGGKLWRYDGSDWEQVTSDGFGDVKNYKIEGFYTAGAYLYAGVVNDTTGMELWRTSDGAAGTWTQVNSDGFGDSNNVTSMASNAMTTFMNRLFVGTWNWGGAGGEIWAAKPTSYTISGQVSGLQAGDVVAFQLKQNGNLLRTQALTAAGATLNYAFTNLGNGQYWVVPSSGLYTFTPKAFPVTISNADQTGQNFTASTPGALALIQPMDGAKPLETPILLEWGSVAGAGIKYQLQVSTNPTFATTFKNQTGLTSPSYLLSGTVKSTIYYWRVRSYTGAAPTPANLWSVVWTFATPNPPGLPVLALPAAGAVVTTTEPFFRWTAPAGTPAAAYYRLQISQKINFTTLDVDEYVYGGESWFYLNQSLIHNKAYYWRVRAYSATGHAGAWTGARKFITWPEQPWLDNPCDWCTTETLRPTFQWNDNTNTGAYQIVISKFGAVVLTKDLTGKFFMPPVSLVPGERYWWRVRGKGLGGYGPWSEIRTFWAPYPPGVPVLTAPVNNSVISGADELQWRPTFTWNEVSGAKYYRLQVSPQSAFPEWDIPLWMDLDATSFDWWGAGSFDPNNPKWLEPNRAYFWHVQACNEEKQCSLWSPTWKFFTRPGKLQLRYPFDYQYVSKTGFYAGWDGLPWPEQWVNSEKFTLQFSTSPTFTVIAKTVSVANQWWAQVSLPAAGTYYWRARAEGVGGASGYGAWSDVWRVVADNPLAAPGLVAPAADATVPDMNNVLLDWNAVAGAVNYNLEVARDASFTDQVFNKWGLASTDQSMKTSPGVFYWRVSANNNHGVPGVWSAARKFVTLSQIAVNVNDFISGGGLDKIQIRAVKVGAPAVVFNCTTDPNGNCWLSNMPAGTYTLTATVPAEYINFANTASVVLGASRYVWQGFSLVPKPAPSVLAVVTTWPSSANRILENHMWLGSGPGQTHISASYRGLQDDSHNPPNVKYAEGYGLNTRVMLISPTALAGGTYPFAVQQVYPGAAVPLKSFGVKVAVFDSFGAMLAGPFGPPTLGSGQWWHVFNMVKSVGAVSFVTAPAPIGTLLLNSPVASNPGSLSGCAVTENGLPIPDLSINISGPAYASFKTSSDGCWELTGLPAGDYAITPDTSSYPTWSPAVPLAVVGYDPAVGADVGILRGTPSFSLLGDATSVKVQGHYAYALFGEALEVINISNRGSPAFVSRTQIAPHDGSVLAELALAGNYAYVVGDNGLTIVDIANPAEPQVIGNTYLGGLTDVEVAGKYAYVATQDSLMVFDVSLPSHPTLVGKDSYGEGVNSRIALRGNFVHMAAWDNNSSWYFIWDVANPAAPAIVFKYWLEGQVTDITLNSEQVFLTGYKDDGGGGTDSYIASGGFYCGPDFPCKVVTYNLNGAGVGTGNALRVAVLHNQRYPYIADAGDGLIVVDANDAWNLLETGFYAASGSTDVELDSNNYAYLLKNDRLLILNAGDPSNPTLAGTYIPTP